MVIEQQLIRKLLSEIVKTKPDIISTDYKWLTETLKEKYLQNSTNSDNDCNKEINGLANCLFWGIVNDIRQSYSRTLDIAEAKNILRQLVRDYGQQEDLARWCIDSWCNALGKESNLAAIEAISLRLPLLNSKPNLPSSNIYSEEIYKEVVTAALKNQELDLNVQLELTVKGKQLGLTDKKIKSVFDYCLVEVANNNKRIEEQTRLELIKKEQEKLKALEKQQEDERKRIRKIQEEARNKIELEKQLVLQEIKNKELAKKTAAEEDEKLRSKTAKEFFEQIIFSLITAGLFILVFIIISIYNYFKH